MKKCSLILTLFLETSLFAESVLPAPGEARRNPILVDEAKFFADKASVLRVNRSVKGLEMLVASLAGPDGKIDFEHDKMKTLKVIDFLLKPYRGLMLRKMVLSMAYFTSYPLMSGRLSQLMTAIEKKEEPVLPAMLLFMSACFAVGIQAIENYDSATINAKIRLEIGQVLLEYLKRQDYEFFQSNASSVLTNKIGTLSWAIPELGRALFEWAPGCASLVATTLKTTWNRSRVEMLATSAWFTMSLLLGIKSSANASKFSIKMNEMRTSASQERGDLLNNISAVKIFANNYYEQLRDGKCRADVLEAEKDSAKAELKSTGYQGLNLLTYQGLVLARSLKGLREGSLTSGDVLSSINNSQELANVLRMLPYISQTLLRELHNSSEALAVLLQPRKVIDKPDATKLLVQRGEIVFENAFFKYANSDSQFKNSFVIKPKEKVGVVGSSGAGKTTLTNLMLRFYDVSSGAIKIDGQNIADVTQDSLRRSIAYVPQGSMLFNRSMMDNIRYGRVEATDEEVVEAAKKAHIHEFIMTLPEGYQTMVGERGCKLSGGQAQRVGIARAILKDAPVLILDEATSALDSITEESIQQDMNELMKDRTALIIAHRLGTLKNVDRILVFDAGSVVAQGTHDELLKSSEIYRNLWESQNKKVEA